MPLSRLRRRRALHRRPLVHSDVLADACAAYARNILAGQHALLRPDAAEIADTELLRDLVRTERERAAGTAVTPEKTLRRLRRAVRNESFAGRVPACPGPLGTNLASLSTLLGFAPVDTEVLQFLVVVAEEPRLQALTSRFADSSLGKTARLVASAVARPVDEVLGALDPLGKLLSSGLVRLSEDLFIEDMLHVDRRLTEVLLRAEVSPERLLERFLPAAEAPTLDLADYAHVSAELEFLVRLVTNALATREAGVNVLLHGPTGTGKTELARLVAHRSSARLFVAGRETKAGESANPRQRLSSLLLGNQLLGASPSVLLFDEMEDLFGGSSFDFESDGDPRLRAPTSKQWFNRLLETNRVPTLWVSNSVSEVDPAYLRRFTHSLALPPLGRAQRRRVWERHLGDSSRELSSGAVELLSQRYATSAAQVATVVRAARLAGGGHVREEDLQRLAGASHALVTGRRERAPAAFTAASYDVSLLQTPVDLAQVADRLTRFRPGAGPGVSLCLYGPPGTGKTEFVRYLAHRLDRPLAVHRVSDLESMWVGEAEKNIAQAFRAAEDDGALLVFDEADSFLRDRRDAQRGWEVTRVNEFLQQLEQFPGIVACTTNLFRQLDQAALRRFSFKVPFAFPSADKAARLFRLAFAEICSDELDDTELERRMRELPNVAPGDFAAVLRRLRITGGPLTIAELVAELQLECAVKETKGRAIGF